MFYLKEALHRLKNIHQRSLRSILQDHVLKFIALLVHASEKSIHQKYPEFLMIL